MKASIAQRRWVSLEELEAYLSNGWRILSYGTGPKGLGVLLALGA